MSYKRGIENTNHAVFEGAGAWEIPKLKGNDSIDIVSWQLSKGGVCVG